MKTFTVIHYRFGATSLVYTGPNEEIARKALNNDPDHNGLHIWENDQEIQYETQGQVHTYPVKDENFIDYDELDD